MKTEGSMDLFSTADDHPLVKESGRESKEGSSVLHGGVRCLHRREEAALLT